MTVVPKRVDPNAYRTRHFGDLEVGERFVSDWTSLSIDRMRRFAEEYDPQVQHLDPDADSRFDGLIASGAHTFAEWNRINLELNGDIAWIAGLGFEEFRFPTALRPGMEFRASSELLTKRLSSSDPTRGVVQHRYGLVTRSGETVFTCLCTALVEVDAG